MAKSKRRAKRSGRAEASTGSTAPTSGLKDARPPEPDWDKVGREVFGVPGLDEATVRYLLDHQEDEECREITLKLAAYLEQQEQSESESNSQSHGDAQTSGPDIFDEINRDVEETLALLGNGEPKNRLFGIPDGATLWSAYQEMGQMLHLTRFLTKIGDFWPNGSVLTIRTIKFCVI